MTKAEEFIKNNPNIIDIYSDNWPHWEFVKNKDTRYNWASDYTARFDRIDRVILFERNRSAHIYLTMEAAKSLMKWLKEWIGDETNDHNR